MSVGSISATLIETKATMRRLREVSRFECDVRVLRNGFWRFVSSGELVPGDIYELSDPNLTQFPADSILLSGDCIVNESMLTGEFSTQKISLLLLILVKANLSQFPRSPQITRP
jgi:cation-transporting ATPase 13A2